MALNNVDYIARLVHLPELKHTKEKNIPFISFQIVVNDYNTVMKKKEDVYIKCMAWGNTAKNVLALGGPRQKANFIGKTRNRKNTATSGVEYNETYALIEKVIYLESRGKDKDYYYEGIPTAHEKAAEKKKEEGTEEYVPQIDVTEDDLPF